MLTQEQLAAEGVAMTPHFVGTGLSNIFHVPAGKVLGQHAHALGHHSMLLLGQAVLRDIDGDRALTAPATIFLPANRVHEVIAVTDILWACTWPDTAGLLEATAARGVAA